MKKVSFWKYIVDTVLHSYSQMFFSQDKLFACLIILVTFFEPKIGLMGLSAVLLVNLLAYIFGFDRNEIREGIFGFNALLFGLAMGFKFEVNAAFLLLFFIANLFLLVLTALFKGSFGKVQLPFLSFPFLVCVWLVSLASHDLSKLIQTNHFPYSDVGIPSISHFFDAIIHSLDKIYLPTIIQIFFKTLSATFFISSVLGGLIIAIGLFLFSRISFSLAILGFCTAYFVYLIFGADLQQLSANMVGSNYIFFSIAIGGFYLIPNKYSYGVTMLLIPVLLLMQIALDKLFIGVGLKTYTLAFSLLTTIFLYALHQRWLHQFLHLVTIQYYSAEKAVYKYLNSISRFHNAHFKKIALPFWGNWNVSQGYEGNITHLGDWSKALDFVVTNGEEKTYQEPGLNLGDFYCYNKPVLAPADGYVYEIVNHIDDNEIGNVDVDQNWGNTIILNHMDGLFSQLSHLKKDSFKVAVGEFVTKGSVLASCGSSGRSPEPHLHFQLQNSPTVGSKTIEYPLAYFLANDEKNEQSLRIFDVPKEGEQIANVESNLLLNEAFNWIPGKKLRFINQENLEVIEWEVFTDSWNRLYLFEAKSKSYAYFINDGTRFYFTDFEGNRNSPLFHLYLSCYSILLGAYPKIKLYDQLPLIHFNSPYLIWMQDILAPFYLFTEARYQSNLAQIDQLMAPQLIQIESKVEAYLLKKRFKQNTYSLMITEKGLQEISFNSTTQKEKWVCAN